MYSIDPEKFGERLKDAIRECGTTQKDLAEKIGISKTSISNYANGRIPEVPILYEITDFLGVTMEWLLTGKEPGASECDLLDDLTEEEKDELNLFLDFLRYKRSVASQDKNISADKKDSI